MLSALFYPKVPYVNVPFDNLYFPHILEELHIKQVYRDIFFGKKDLVVIDAGANCGLATQYFREYAKHVYSIEPSPEHFEALAKNKEFNQWKNVTLIHAGLSDHDGEEMIYFNPGNRTMNSLTSNYGHGGEKVKTITLETIFKEYNLKEVDFLKMDVEGSEVPVIKSEEFKRVLPKIKAMVIEFHQNDWQQLVDYIVSFGFKTKREVVDTISIQFYR